MTNEKHAVDRTGEELKQKIHAYKDEPSILFTATFMERSPMTKPITADQDLAAACREWIKGCTCAARDTPQECEECTSAFLQAVLDRARRHGLEIGQNSLEALPND